MTDSLPPGTVRSVAHYEIEKVLGRGSVGTVYLARDKRIGRRVALKIVETEHIRFEDDRDEREFYDRLQREVEIGGRLNHINLVTLYDVGYASGRISYLAMELVDGPSLLDLIKERKPQPLPLVRVLEVATDILKGLAFAHAQGVVHRDIKPANILITKERVAKIADFGIARPDESSLTMTGTLMGTPNYMSPEQVKGETPIPQSDLFSLGTVLYEMTTGQKPFIGTDISGVLYKVVSQPHSPIESAEVPSRLKKLIDALLEKSPDDRPASAEEVLAEIASIEAGVDTRNEITSIGTRLPEDTTAPGTANAEVEDLMPIESSGLTILKRAIPTSAFWLVIAIWLGGLGALALSIAARIDPSPTVTIPHEKILEFAAKKRALDDAAQLCSDGKFDECIEAYENYLASYPDARAASTARDEAVRLRSEIHAGGDAKESTSAWKRFTSRVKRIFGKD